MCTISSSVHPRCWAQRGFSLTEVLVALAIGILSTMAVLQILSVSEGQKRTITGVADAETNGAFALYTLQRDIRQNGYGISSMQLFGCAIVLRSGVTLNALAPIRINPPDIPAGDPNTDTLLVAYGTGNGSTEGDLILPESTNKKATARGAYYTIMAAASLAPNDWIIATQSPRPATCSWNLDRVQGAVGSTNAAFKGGTLFNLGQTPRIVVYAIRGGNLTVCNFLADNCADANLKANDAVWVTLASDIVSLRAQYGRDTSVPMDGSVDVDATGADCFDQLVESPTTHPNSPSRACSTARDPSVPTVECGWARISAVRIVVVARGGVREANEVTTVSPTWFGSALTPINLSTTGTDWRHYRYREFQTVVPMRNIILMGAQLGC